MQDTVLKEIPEEIMAYAGHRYVRLIAKNGDFYYTDDFYSAMYEKITQGNMSYVEAYNALGFDTEVLTEARANSAGTRAVKRMKNRKLFEKSPADFDSDTTFEEMVKKCVDGDMSREELYANMAARLIVLEEMNKALKKLYNPNRRRRNKCRYGQRAEHRRENQHNGCFYR